MQIFPRLKPHRFSRSDTHLSPSPRIPPNPGLPRLNRKNPESTQLNPIARDQRLLHAVEDGVDRVLGFGSWEPGALDDSLY